MTTKKQAHREFWLDIATPYGDPCDFIHTECPYEEAKRLGTHPCVSATNIHVIEYSALEESQKQCDLLDKENAILREAVTATLNQRSRGYPTSEEWNEILIKNILAKNALENGWLSWI